MRWLSGSGVGQTSLHPDWEFRHGSDDKLVARLRLATVDDSSLEIVDEAQDVPQELVAFAGLVILRSGGSLSLH